LASSSFDATACVWSRGADLQYEVVAQMEGHENEVKGVAWNNDGKYLATSSRDKSVWIWEGENTESEYD
jgi:cytosolic iron-sulfur protein assembly protein CIAO1